MITVTLTGDTPRDVVSQFAALFGLPNPVGAPADPASASNGSLQNGSAAASAGKPTLVEKTDNVTDLMAAAKAEAAKPRGRPRKGAAALAAVPDPEPEPEPDTAVDADGEEPDPELDEASQVSDVVDQLTALYQGGDAETRNRIKSWRDSQGLKLLRDLAAKHVPSALQFLDELTA